MQKKMLEFLCIAGVPGGRNVVSPAPGKILSLPAEESHGCGSPPLPGAYSFFKGKKNPYTRILKKPNYQLWSYQFWATSLLGNRAAPAEARQDHSHVSEGRSCPKPSKSTLWSGHRPHFLTTSAPTGLPWCQHTHCRMWQEKPW